MLVVRYRKIFFIISGFLLAVSIAAMFLYGFNISIDFKGGTLTEVKYAQARPTQAEVESKVGALNLGGFSVRPSGDTNYVVRTKELSQNENQALQRNLAVEPPSVTIERQNSIGPVAGAELKNKAVKAILVVILMIVLFITFAFRKVSKPVASWKYGLATVIALLHDVVIPTGVFIFLGRFYGVEIDLLFVSGLLAILGYSVHDTIVVFDRVRENLRVNGETHVSEEFETTVGKSITQTMARSINTSLTLLITLTTLYLVGSGATKDFSLLLIIGVIIGTYSSIFVASPLLVTFFKLQRK